MSHGDPSSSEHHTDLPGFMGLIGRHPKMQRVYDLIRRVGRSTAPVLITGESGTGKELVAQALHRASPRRGDRFVPVHCGAIPEDLLESELFGHVKGAFTGAIGGRTGRFRLAHGGTILLDEIGEMSPRFQVKLLRVLENGSFEPVGSEVGQQVDVRVLAATHRDLRSLAREGAFRSDLLYRLDVIPIHLPALRDRREDIPLLAGHFLHALASRGFPHFALGEETGAALMAYDWPGNVRELRNVLERAVLLSDGVGVLQPWDLPPPFGDHQTPSSQTRAPQCVTVTGWPWDFGPEGTDFYLELESFERRMIGRALELARGSKREAARLLQVNRTTLLEKLKRKGWNLAGPTSEGLGVPAQATVEHPDGGSSPLSAPAARSKERGAGPSTGGAAAESWSANSPSRPPFSFLPSQDRSPVPQRAVV
jgi:DNA-binding NtrC family response regulator